MTNDKANLRQTVDRIRAERSLPPTPQSQPPPAFDAIAFRHQQNADRIARSIPPEFHHAEPDHPQILKWVDRYLTDPADCPSLLLVGNTGTGKTYQAVGALRRIITTHADAGRSIHWRFVDHPTFNDHVLDFEDQAHVRAMEHYLNADLLIFDDLGAGMRRDWVTQKLLHVVNHRWGWKKPTIYTSNLVDTLDATVGDRMWSRLGPTVHIIFDGDDRRWT